MLAGGFVINSVPCLGLMLSHVLGHTLMQHPIPFPSQLKDNGPMAKDGSNWPCSGETEYDWSGISNIWQRGSQQYLQAMGGASHGGGSCQISITTDLKPTRKSEFRVIHSIEGGCPIRNLTEANYGDSATVLLPSIYNFTVPSWVPIGPVVMAWTWYGRWSVPEMFMNCAPVMVLGHDKGADVPDAVLDEHFDNAPLIFEANNGNGCWTLNTGNCVKFPNPGTSVEVNAECPFDEQQQVVGTCSPEFMLGSRRQHSFIYTLLYAMFAMSFMFGVFVGAKRLAVRIRRNDGFWLVRDGKGTSSTL
ncbi:putative Endoglucanase [Seiridium cardinale]